MLVVNIHTASPELDDYFFGGGGFSVSIVLDKMNYRKRGYISFLGRIMAASALAIYACLQVRTYRTCRFVL